MANDPSRTPSPDPRLTRRRPTDDELERASEITESDVDAAVESWTSHAPAEARSLMDAQPIDGE